MKVFTHKKRPYMAVCLQLSAATEEAMIVALEQAGARVQKYQGQLMLRWPRPQPQGLAIEMMAPGDWLRVGENGSPKIMTAEVFYERYEEIE